ncbi:hypothetical protein M407DRAFT_20285 [Tulasnella calospora MUT 4182]|uniref:Uncharacterized protein n=1 Tax=Tulasnella calospora MUT 4182 TaxID=1051891 RepID=A0A0C3QGI6_9AGAM|nr:hypothetical protein M407DRAFT_20285 [Tulasnella calospora MUT 4182]
MSATTSAASNVTLPSSTPSSVGTVTESGQNPVVAFLIGLAIILFSSILNAGGLNLTKLDHLRTSALPKSARKKDFLRPLWVLGMILYILSQLIGSTLALEYMRAEYVAPLGSTSLVFNFMFASLIGTPVTKWDIYGTVVVVAGVIGIVAFGSVNSGLHPDTDLDRLKTMWSRPGWLGYFVLMALGIIIVYIGTSQLDAIWVARGDLQALPTSRTAPPPVKADAGWWASTKGKLGQALHWTKEKLDNWTAAKDDKYVAWMLGIGWSCVGGALAGGCLIFAKAIVKLVSAYMSGHAPGSQFASPATIVTIILLAATAISQIVALNRGLKVYESTLVVPMFYGIYTASGFLNSLIFNDEVDAYKPWTLFCLFLSIVVLISGVVLLTHKKPEPKPAANPTGTGDDAHSMRTLTSPSKSQKAGPRVLGEDQSNWSIGAESESEAEGPSTPKKKANTLSVSPAAARLSPVQSLRESVRGVARRVSEASSIGLGLQVQKHSGEEGKGLMGGNDDDDDESPVSPRPVRQAWPERNASSSSLETPSQTKNLRTRSASIRSDDFGEWEDGNKSRR